MCYLPFSTHTHLYPGLTKMAHQTCSCPLLSDEAGVYLEWDVRIGKGKYLKIYLYSQTNVHMLFQTNWQIFMLTFSKTQTQSIIMSTSWFAVSCFSKYPGTRFSKLHSHYSHLCKICQSVESSDKCELSSFRVFLYYDTVRYFHVTRSVRKTNNINLNHKTFQRF